MVAEIGVLWGERDGERERESVPEGHSEGEKIDSRSGSIFH